MTGPKRKRDPKPTYPLDPAWIAYLRLKGIAERRGGRVARAALVDILAPSIAVATFQMRGGWYVTAAICGEAYWRELATTWPEAILDHEAQRTRLESLSS